MTLWRKIRLLSYQPADVMPVHSPHARSEQERAKGELIVVVDDSPTVRKIVETVLEREGYEVLSFPDGVELFHWLAGPAARPPALLILDVRLPKIDGYELALRLKKKSLLMQTVILMLTRRDGLLDRLKGHLAGAKVYMTKPMKTQDLLAAVAFCLGKGALAPSSSQSCFPPPPPPY